MRARIFATCLLLLALATVACADEPADAAVRSALQRFLDAFNNLDWPTFRAAFADDVSVINPDIPEAPGVGRVDGRAAVEQGFLGVFEATRRDTKGPPYLHIVPQHLAIQRYGDVAVTSFEFDRPDHSMGRRTIVFHDDHGTWKIVHIHASNAARRP